jgi:hypothetical protein
VLGFGHDYFLAFELRFHLDSHRLIELRFRFVFVSSFRSFINLDFDSFLKLRYALELYTFIEYGF